MYNTSPQGLQSAVYESTNPFQTRQPAAPMQMSPDMTGQFFQNEPASAASASGLQHHAPSSSSIYQQGPASRDLQQGLPSSLTMGGTPQPVRGAMGQQSLQGQVSEVEAGYATYQTTMREVFQNVINGRLAEASRSLLEATEWLLGHVGDLGEYRDSSS
jgi:hypothetical protein